MGPVGQRHRLVVYRICLLLVYLAINGEPNTRDSQLGASYVCWCVCTELGVLLAVGTASLHRPRYAGACVSSMGKESVTL